MGVGAQSEQELRAELGALRARIAELEHTTREPDPRAPALPEGERGPDLHERALLELQKLCHEDHESSVDCLLRTNAETLSVERVSFWSVDSRLNSIAGKRLYVLSQERFLSDGLHDGVGHVPHFIEALTEQGAIDAPDVFSDERTRELCDAYFADRGVTSVLAVPVWSCGTLEGVLLNEHQGTERIWNRSEREFAQSVARIMALSIEASRRKEAEQAINVSEKGYLAFMEATPDPMVVYDTNGKVTYLNPAFSRVFGWTLDEKKGQTLDFVPEENVAETQETVQRMLREEQAVSLDTRRLTKDGRVLDILASATTFKGADGKMAGSIVTLRDITEKREIETALRESEERFRDLYQEASRTSRLHRRLLDASPDPIVVYDTDGVPTYVNPAFTRVFGWEFHEIEGKTLDFVPEENWPETKKYIEKLLRGEDFSQFESRRYTKDGRTIDVSLSGGAFFDEKDQNAGGVVHIRDITGRRKAELELRRAHEDLETRVSERTAELAEANRALERENSDRLRAEQSLDKSRQMLDNILNASPIAIVYYEDGKLAWLNRTMSEMFGDQEYEGRLPDEFYSSPEEYQRVRSLFSQSIKNNKMLETEAQFRRADGFLFPGLLRLTTLDRDHPGKGNIATIVDLTEIKQAESERQETEERYKTLVEESFDGIMIHNGRTIAFANSRLHQILGYADGELVGEEYWRIYHPDDRSTVQERVRARLKGKDVPAQYELMLQRKDGAFFDCEINARTIQHGDQVHVQVWIRDISERKRVERELVQSQETLTKILSTSPVGIGKAGDRKIRWLNKAWIDMFGFENEEDYLGKSTAILYDGEEEYRKIGRLQDNKVRVGQTAEAEARFRRKDGTVFEGHITLASMDPLNPSSDVIAAITDISERKEAERSLQQSEKTARALLKATPDGALLLNTEGTILETNGVAERLLGASADAIVGQMLTDLLPTELAQRMGRRTEEVITWGTPTRFQHDFNERSLDYTIYPLFDPEGTVVRLAVFARDITDQMRTEEALKESEERHKKLYEESRRSEELYRSLLNSSADAVVIYDMEGKTTYVNPSFTRIFGWTMEEVDGQRIDFVPSTEREATTEVIRSVVWEGKPWSDFETKRYTKDGRALDVSVSGSRYHDHQGNPVGTMVILRDITERKRAQTELAEALETAKQLRSEAEAASTAKSDFVANMSHEIRTPMNAIIGLAELALRNNPSSKLKDFLTKIGVSSRSLLGIINDILDFSKIEAGKLTIESVDFDLRDVMSNLTDLLGDAASRKGVELLVAVGSDVPCALTGDPLRLGQILTNLTNNALKFTEKGEIVVQAALVKDDRKTATIDFSVKDSGIGIAPEKIATLFESFTQADGSTTRKYGGSGLGLTISKRLIEMMGGSISVESELDKGATFRFRLELSRRTLSEDSRYKPHPDLEGLRVLVVDDNRMAREILLEMLRSFTFEATAVQSGEESLEELVAAANDRPYDLVLMDWNMPEMDGIEAARLINQNPGLQERVPKIIMITAFGNEEIMDRAEQAGLAGFLTKPVNQSLLFDTIMEVFGKEVRRSRLREKNSQPELESAARIRGARILLAEDNEINQLVATEILEGVHATVHVVRNGQEAVEAVDESDFDAVLMDIQMPKMDGYDATRLIRKEARHRDLPIIAMTAHALKGDREKSLNAGMNDHVTKPIGIDEVVAVLAKWLHPKPGVAAEESSEQDRKESAEEASLPDALPGIRIKSAVRRFGGKAELFRKVLATFRKDYINAIREIEESLEQGDFERAQRMAHTIKGLAGNLGAASLSESSGTLESRLQNGAKEDLEELLSQIERDLREVLDSAAVLESQAAPESKEDRVPDGVDTPDATELAVLIVELDALIRKGHFGSFEAFQALQDKMGHNGPQEKMNQLKELLDKFDFSAARKVLDSIAASLEISLEEVVS